MENTGKLIIVGLPPYICDKLKICNLKKEIQYLETSLRNRNTVLGARILVKGEKIVWCRVSKSQAQCYTHESACESIYLGNSVGSTCTVYILIE